MKISIRKTTRGFLGRVVNIEPYMGSVVRLDPVRSTSRAGPRCTSCTSQPSYLGDYHMWPEVGNSAFLRSGKTHVGADFRLHRAALRRPRPWFRDRLEGGLIANCRLPDGREGVRTQVYRGLHVADAFVFRATKSAPRDIKRIAGLVNNCRRHSKAGVD